LYHHVLAFILTLNGFSTHTKMSRGKILNPARHGGFFTVFGAKIRNKKLLLALAQGFAAGCVTKVYRAEQALLSGILL